MIQDSIMGKLKAIHQQNNDTIFRLALQSLISAGHRHITEEIVAREKKSLRMKSPKNSLVSVECQYAILDTVLALSKIPAWDIMLYMKLYVPIKGDDLLKFEAARQAVAAWNSISVPKTWKDAIADPDVLENILQIMVKSHHEDYSDAEIKDAFCEVVGDPNKRNES